MGSQGISILVDSVTLDLIGFSLVGAGGTGGSDIGILAYNGKGNIEIRNGTIRNFSGYGISIFDSATYGHRVIGIRAVHNGKTGIHLDGLATERYRQISI